MNRPTALIAGFGRVVSQQSPWRRWLGGALLVGAAVLSATPLRAAPRIVEMTPEQLTAEARLQFPQRRCAGGIACLTLSEPKVQIQQGQPRLFLSARASPALGAQQFDSGLIEVGAMPEYRTDEGAFFLKDSAVTRFEFPGLDPQAAATIASLIKPLITETLATTPLWALDETDPQQAMLRLVLQKVEVVEGRLRLTIGR